MNSNEKDINDIFSEIVLLEENITKKSYQEGFADGVEEGKLEGYKLGRAQGILVGEEIGLYYGTIVAHLQLTDSERVKKALQSLKKTIENFSRTNDKEADIIGNIRQIRTEYRKIKAMLKLPLEETLADLKDLTF